MSSDVYLAEMIGTGIERQHQNKRCFLNVNKSDIYPTCFNINCYLPLIFPFGCLGGRHVILTAVDPSISVTETVLGAEPGAIRENIRLLVNNELL